MNSWIFIVIFLVLMFAKVPIAFSLGLASAYYFINHGVPIETLVQIMLSIFHSFPMLAIPFFMLAASIMNTGGITKRLFETAKLLVIHIPGGLGQVNIIASLIFAGISGSATADAAGLGIVEIEAMLKEKYDPAFSAAVTAASSVVGPIFPPSLGFVLYGSITGTSVGALFIAGVIPAIIMVAGMMLVVYIIAKKKKFKVYKRAKLKEILISFKSSLLPMLTPIIILGGILGGIVTPTEAAVIAIMYSIFLGAVVYKELNVNNFITTIIETGKTASKLMLIVSMAGVFGWILAYEGIPAKLATLLFSISDHRNIILLLAVLLILFLGCFMEGISILLIVVPILLPVLKNAGIDLVHFGVVQSIANNIGLITPPLGIAGYIVADIAKVSFEKVVSVLVPFIIILIVALFIIAYFPRISLWLPTILMGYGT